jgi:hypothetical protein
MSWRTFRRVWVIACNLLFIGFSSFGLLDDYRLYELSGLRKPPKALLDVLGPVFLIALACSLDQRRVLRFSWIWRARESTSYGNDEGPCPVRS